MDYLAGGVRFVWNGDKSSKGLQQEKGWGEGERKKLIGMIASKENGGITPQKAAHQIVDLYGQDLHLSLDESQHIVDTLLDALGDIATRGDAADYIRRKKLEAVRDELSRRIVGERDSYEADADAQAEAERQQIIDEHPELGDNPTDEEILAARERDLKEKGEGGDAMPNEQLAELEKEFNARGEEMSQLEQEWDDKIKDYVAEKSPTQATTTAETDSPVGKAERAAMLADPEYKRLLEEQERALDEAKKKEDDAYKAWQEALRGEDMPNETGIDDSFFEQGEDEYVPFRDGEGDTLSEDDVEKSIKAAKENAEKMPEPVEFSKENWEKAFPDESITTPLGKIKIGGNQFEKMESKNRQGEIGLMKATLERPDFIVEENSPEEGAERQSKYLFIKTFVKEDGSTYRHYESVTIQRDGQEISISSHYIGENKLREALLNDRVLYDKNSLSSNGSENRLAETQTGRSDLLPTPDENESLSGDKGTTESSNLQENGEKTTEGGELLRQQGERRHHAAKGGASDC